MEALLSLVKLIKVVFSEFKVNLFEQSQEEMLVKSNCILYRWMFDMICLYHLQIETHLNCKLRAVCC